MITNQLLYHLTMAALGVILLDYGIFLYAPEQSPANFIRMPEILFLWERPPGRDEAYNKVRQPTMRQVACGVDTRGLEAAPTGGSSCPSSSPGGALYRNIILNSLG